MRNAYNKGGALLYILIAVALLTALYFAVSRDTRTNTTQYDASRIKLLASDLIKHATAADMAVQQMSMAGIDYDEIRFNLPGTAAYNSNVNEQIYHPRGGGLQPMDGERYVNDVNNRAWQGVDVNIEWSSTSSTDITYSFLDIDRRVCAEINNQLHGDPTIPMTTIHFGNTFVAGTDPFTAATCSECVNARSMCVENVTSTAFYNILGMR